MVNLQVWEGLTPSEQMIIQAAIEAEAWREYSEFNARNADALKVLVEDHGVELRRFNDDLLKAIGKTSGEVVAEVGASDPMTQKIYDSYMDFRRKAVSWGEIAEQGYYNARSLPFEYGG
jgi:TRAP-type mannitol/chloroaromatic compound transport system substrate-binding protein